MSPIKRIIWSLGLATMSAGLVLLLLDLALGQQIQREGFEGREPSWIKGAADVVFREVAHKATDETYHGGQRSETIQLKAEQGNYIHYYYETRQAPIGEDLNAGLWLKANRPGMQLLARVVLPREKNPKHADEPLTVVLRGDLYKQAGRWQHLEIRHPAKLTKDQQQLLRTELNHDINITDAYIDRLMLNLYAGPGDLQVWIDDLEIGPVSEAGATSPLPRSSGRDKTAGRTKANHAALVKLEGPHLNVSGRSFFFRAIRHTDTPLKALRDAGFNTLWMEDSTPPETVDEAVDQGFWIIPGLTLGKSDKTENLEPLAKVVSSLVQHDAVLFVDIGKGGLAKEQVGPVGQLAKMVKAADPSRLTGADVWDGFGPYSRNVQMLGVHRWPLMTGLELVKYRDWLNQRRLLADPYVFMWTWVQTHLPDWYTNLVYEQSGSQAFKDPIGPQPEQIRLLTYIAIASGCKGLGYWSDRFLADSHQGRDRLLGMALLNQELQLLEPMLVKAESPIWIDTSDPNVKAAVLRTKGLGLLVLPIWMGQGGQFVPGQAASLNLTLEVPVVPKSMQAWQVSPGEVRALKAGWVGVNARIVIPEFGLTSAIVLTNDIGIGGMVVRFQDKAREMSKMAAQWAHSLAEVELDKVTRVYADLEKAGHGLPDGQKLLENARKRIQTCVALWNSSDYRESYNEANRALRPLRILMRECWGDAVKDLAAQHGADSAVASPFAVSFFTLPQHWKFMDQIKRSTPGLDILPNGGFEQAPDKKTADWLLQEETLDEVDMKAQRVAEAPKEGRQCLKLEIKAKTTVGPDNQVIPPPAALERTYLAIHSPAMKLQPGQLVRISGWIKIPKAPLASADGVLLYDSAGGEPLAERITGEVKNWKKIVLFRRVPADGTISVTLAMTGLGVAYFDDIRVEPLNPNQSTSASGKSQDTRLVRRLYSTR